MIYWIWLFALTIPLYGQGAPPVIRDLIQEVGQLREKVRCFEMEQALLDEKIEGLEQQLKNKNEVAALEKRCAQLEQKLSEQHTLFLADLQQLQEALSKSLAKITEVDESAKTSSKQLKGAVEKMATLLLGDKAPSLKSDKMRYKVKAGDTLDRIAKQFKISTDQLKQWNHLTKDRITIDQELVVGE